MKYTTIFLACLLKFTSLPILETSSVILLSSWTLYRSTTASSENLHLLIRFESMSIRSLEYWEEEWAPQSTFFVARKKEEASEERAFSLRYRFYWSKSILTPTSSSASQRSTRRYSTHFLNPILIKINTSTFKRSWTISKRSSWTPQGK